MHAGGAPHFAFGLPFADIAVAEFAEAAVNFDLASVVGHQVGLQYLVLPVGGSDDPGNQYVKAVRVGVLVARDADHADDNAGLGALREVAVERASRLLPIDDLRVVDAQDGSPVAAGLLRVVAIVVVPEELRLLLDGGIHAGINVRIAEAAASVAGEEADASELV
jgi:hypothetical protein